MTLVLNRLVAGGLVCAAALTAVSTGCHKPEKWSYTGPRVYLIEGDANEDSDGLSAIQRALVAQEINAEIYTPEDWLRIVVDIDADYDEEVILVGHGHGAFLAAQVVRHYAQHHKTKFIEAVFTMDAFNKDWPHNANELGLDDPHLKPMQTPIGHNAIKVRNYNQKNADCERWGSDLVSSRASNLANAHPYYWYDDYWDRRRVTGQVLRGEIEDAGVVHETIDNDAALVHRIIMMCRKAALSPYHYTPPEHHPNASQEDRSPTRGSRRKQAV